MVSDQDRRDLYEVLERQLGRRAAATMMELLPPVGWGDVARRSDLVAVRGEMAELKGHMAELRAELKGGIGELRTELKTEVGELRTEVGELRTELQAQLPRLYAGNMAMAFATAGLVLAAAKLA